MTKIKYIILLTCTVFLFSNAGFGQQDPLFPQYSNNKMLLNAGYTGSREVLSGDVLFRSQWAGVTGAPKTFSTSFHSPLPNPHLAVGIAAYSDQAGPQTYSGMVGSFAYRVLFPESKLSFGLQAGFKRVGIDWDKLNYQTAESNQQKPATTKPDVNFGIYYAAPKYYVGFSSNHLLQNQEVISADEKGKSELNKLFAQFYLMGGYLFPVNKNITLRPAAIFKFAKNTPSEMDLNLSALVIERFWVGAAYRTSFGDASYKSKNTLAFIADFNISSNWRIGYSFETWLNSLNTGSSGTHEIRLGFDIDLLKKGIKTPIYF